MSDGDHRHMLSGKQFDPLTYNGWSKSAAAFGHEDNGIAVQNTQYQANDIGTGTVHDEMWGKGASDYQPYWKRPKHLENFYPARAARRNYN